MTVIEVWRRILYGFGFAGMVTFVALTILMLNKAETSVEQIWLSMLGSVVSGIYFGVASFIFDNERWSYLKQTVIHFCMSLAILFPVFVFVTGWVPLRFPHIFLGLGIFVGTYALFMLGAYMYFKNLAQKMNESIDKKRR